MKKLTKILIIASIFTLFSFNTFAIFVPQHTIQLSNEEGSSINSLSEPKESAEGDITSLWNYTFTTIPRVAISGDGEHILAINDTCLNTFHRNSNKTLWTYNAGSGIDEEAMSFNGRYIVLSTVGTDNNVTLLDSTSKTEVWTFDDFSGLNYFHVDISKYGNYIAVANSSGVVYLFDNDASAGQKQPEWYYDDGTARSYSDVAISGNGQYIVAGDSGGNITVFTTAPSTQKTFEWQFNMTSKVEQVAISNDGKYVVAKNNDKEVYLFNSTNPGGKYMWNFTSSKFIEVIDISSDGQDIIVGGAKSLYYFNNSYQSGNKTAEWRYNFVDTHPVDDLEIGGGYKGIYYVVMGTYDPTFYLLNSTKTTPKLHIWKNPIHEINSVGISALGNYFFFCSRDTYTIYLYHHDIPIPPVLPPYLAGDDDDDDDDEAAIPYGNHYLVFAGLAMVALILIMKRKALIKQKK